MVWRAPMVPQQVCDIVVKFYFLALEWLKICLVQSSWMPWLWKPAVVYMRYIGVSHLIAAELTAYYWNCLRESTTTGIHILVELYLAKSRLPALYMHRDNNDYFILTCLKLAKDRYLKWKIWMYTSDCWLSTKMKRHEPRRYRAYSNIYPLHHGSSW